MPHKSNAGQLPSFPEFTSVEISHQNALNQITLHSLPYSDFLFSNLWIWNTDGSTLVSELNGNLVVRIFNYDASYFVLTFTGKSQVKETVSALLSYAKEQPDLSNQLEYVHDSDIEGLLSDNEFSIVPERHNFDYIIDAAKLADLSGSENQRKRNALKKFEERYENRVTGGRLDLKDSQVRKDILQVFFDWEKSRNKSREETEDELIGTQRLLDNFSIFDLFAVGVFIDNKMVGFVISELTSAGYAVLHFEKADTSHKDIFLYLKQVNARELTSSGVKYINYEQDLGIEGLRQSKMLMHPVRFLKKYTVGFNDSEAK